MSTNSTPFRSLDQKRAEAAWSFVKEARKELSEKFGDYKNLAAGAPALIQANGLMQVLAFYACREAHHKTLANQLAEWVGRQLYHAQYTPERLLPKLHAVDVDQYMRATEEALELLVWIKQFAKVQGNETN